MKLIGRRGRGNGSGRTKINENEKGNIRRGEKMPKKDLKGLKGRQRVAAKRRVPTVRDPS